MTLQILLEYIIRQLAVSVNSLSMVNGYAGYTVSEHKFRKRARINVIQLLIVNGQLLI